MPRQFNQLGISADDYVGYRPSVKQWGAKGDMYQTLFGWTTVAGSGIVAWGDIADGVMTTAGGAAIAAGSTATVSVNVVAGPGNRIWVNPGAPNAEIITVTSVAGLGGAVLQVTAAFANEHTSGEHCTTAIFAPTDVGKFLGVPGAGAAPALQAPTTGIPGGGNFPVATGALQPIFGFATSASASAAAIALGVTTLGSANLGSTLSGANSPTGSWRFCFQAYGGPVEWGVFGSTDPTFAAETQVYDSANAAAYGSGLSTLTNLEANWNAKVIFQCVGPTYPYYRLKGFATTTPASLHLYLSAHGNTLFQPIVAYVDPLHVIVAAPATYSVSNAYGYFGTDDTAAIQKANVNLVASYTIGGSDQNSSAELYFPPGQYMLTGPVWIDHCRWVGSHTDTQLVAAPGACSIPVYNSQNALWQPLIMLGHGIQNPSPPGIGPLWSGDYPSFGSRLENIAIKLNETPCVGVYCETTQEHTGLRNVDVDGWTGLNVHPDGTATWCDTLSRAAQQIGFGCINNGWDDLAGGAGFTNIPHPQLQLSAAVTATGSQTVAVNRTDFLAVGMAIDVGHLTGTFETISIAAIGTGTVTAVFSQLHAAGDTLLMNWMPVGLDFVVTSRVSVNNVTMIPSAWPGWGYGIRAVGTIMTIEDVHTEQGLNAIFVGAGSMVTIRLLQGQDSTVLIGIYGPVQYSHENISAPRFTGLWYDAAIDTLVSGFFDALRVTSSTEITLDGYGGSAAVSLLNGQLVCGRGGTYISRLFFGQNYPPGMQPSFIPLQTLLGNAVERSQFAIEHGGTGAAPNNFLSILSTPDAGSTWTAPFVIDNYFQAVMTPLLEFSDGMVVIAGTVVLPPLGFGHHVGPSWWEWKHAAPPAGPLSLYATNTAGASWLQMLLLDGTSGVATLNDIASVQFAAPGSVLMSETVGANTVIREATLAQLAVAVNAAVPPSAAVTYPAAGVVPQYTGSAWGSFTAPALVDYLAGAVPAPNLPLASSGAGIYAMNASHIAAACGAPSGGFLTIQVSVPSSHTSSGALGYFAVDSSGNFYFYFAQWYRLGPAGWSGTF